MHYRSVRSTSADGIKTHPTIILLLSPQAINLLRSLVLGYVMLLRPPCPELGQRDPISKVTSLDTLDLLIRFDRSI